MTPHPGPGPGSEPVVPLPVLVFDGECGFCTLVARLTWHLVSRDRFELRPWQQLGPDVLARWGLTEADCREALRFVDRDGRASAGAEAAVASVRHGHRFLAPLGRVLSDPRLTPTLERGYRWVADHRGSLPGVRPACRR